MWVRLYCPGCWFTESGPIAKTNGSLFLGCQPREGEITTFAMGKVNTSLFPK